MEQEEYRALCDQNLTDLRNVARTLIACDDERLHREREWLDAWALTDAPLDPDFHLAPDHDLYLEAVKLAREAVDG